MKGVSQDHETMPEEKMLQEATARTMCGRLACCNPRMTLQDGAMLRSGPGVLQDEARMLQDAVMSQLKLPLQDCTELLSWAAIMHYKNPPERWGIHPCSLLCHPSDPLPGTCVPLLAHVRLRLTYCSRHCPCHVLAHRHPHLARHGPFQTWGCCLSDL